LDDRETAVDEHISVEQARAAAAGDPLARRRVNALVEPMIVFHSGKFCKQFCYGNRFRYRCSLTTPVGGAPDDAALCEWGNASYGWMLDELTRPGRLRRYDARNGASLRGYLFSIAGSLAFYERWKDWRFGRRVHTPTFIQDISPHAGKAFFALRDGDKVPAIAQKLALSETETAGLVSKIMVTLTQKRRLHLLDPPRHVSLDASGPDGDSDAETLQLEWRGISPEQLAENSQLQQAWGQLDPVEQFVLETLVVEEQSARQILDTLQSLDIEIAPGVAADKTNRQQLYYFKRKTLARLARIGGYNCIISNAKRWPGWRESADTKMTEKNSQMTRDFASCLPVAAR